MTKSCGLIADFGAPAANGAPVLPAVGRRPPQPPPQQAQQPAAAPQSAQPASQPPPPPPPSAAAAAAAAAEDRTRPGAGRSHRLELQNDRSVRVNYAILGFFF